LAADAARRPTWPRECGNALARQLGMSRRRLNELVRERRGITPDTAWRLARCFGVDAAFWLHLQAAWDAHRVAQEAQRGA